MNEVLCKICGKRKARRACPAVSGNICSLCCGTEREVTLLCPLDCTSLIEARRREKSVPLENQDLTFAEIEVTKEFIDQHEPMLILLISCLTKALRAVPAAVDHDVRQALEAMIQTLLTRQSGLVYETRPDNAIATEIQDRYNREIDDLVHQLSKSNSFTDLRDSYRFLLLIFVLRLYQQNHNERPKGRMFIDMLRQMVQPPEGAMEEDESLVRL